MGRPKGSKNKKTLLKEAMEGDNEIEALYEAKKLLPDVVRKLGAMALEGNVSAAKLLLDKTLPTRTASSHQKLESVDIRISRAEPPTHGETYDGEKAAIESTKLTEIRQKWPESNGRTEQQPGPYGRSTVQ